MVTESARMMPRFRAPRKPPSLGSVCVLATFPNVPCFRARRRSGYTPRMPTTRPRAISLRLCAATLLAATALYTVFLWPAARHATTDIPRTSRTAEVSRRLPLAPGDHLQLLYHFQLAAQMVRGDIPLFANPWEFNLGTDARIPDPYYVPFSLLYAALERPLGPAGAWNAAQLASVLVGAFLLVLLARRYADGSFPDFLAFVATLAALAVPYRWETLAGGSPTGFGMAWIPGVALGIDIAVRDHRPTGGLLAGLSLLFCYTSDLHSFLFAGLAMPLWCITAALAGHRPTIALEQAPNTERGVARDILLALAPLGAACALALAVAHHVRRAYAATDAAAGRTIADLRCPSWDGLLDPSAHTFMASQFFLGWGLLLVVVLAAILAAVTLVHRSRQDQATVERRRAAVALLLALAVVFAILLAIAQRGPSQGLVLRAVRKLVPPFRMVRQPIKVFSLLPTLLAPLFAWTLSAAIRCRMGNGRHPSSVVNGHRIALAMALLLPILCLVPVLRSMRAGTCVLPHRPSAAYAAAVVDAEERGETARALVLPIWPGDSSWSSLYQFHAAATRMRMVNGYAAVKTPDYVADVFGRYQTVTQGELTDSDLDALARHGVNTLILHEDAFPEKVSPAPVGVTLHRLLAHPRLVLIAQDGPVWSWRILPISAVADSSTPPSGAAMPSWDGEGMIAPARVWHFDPSFQPTAGRPFKAPLHKTALWMRDVFRWHVVRTDGSIEVFSPGEEDAQGTAWLRLDSGAPIRDLLFAPNPYVEPGLLPAADLFHAGFTRRNPSGDPTWASVDLSDVVPGALLLHGPCLLLRDGGAYALAVLFSGEETTHDTVRLEIWLGNRLAAAGGNIDAGSPENPATWIPFEVHENDGPLDIRLFAEVNEGNSLSHNNLEIIGLYIIKRKSTP